MLSHKLGKYTTTDRQTLEINWKMDWKCVGCGSGNGIGRLLDVLDVVPKPWARANISIKC